MSEQDTLRELVADILKGGSGLGTVETLCATFDDAGLFDVGIGEELGGSGGTLADLTSIVETVGVSGSSVPIIEFNIARWISAHSNDSVGLVGRSAAVLADCIDADLPRSELVVPAVVGAALSDNVILCARDGRAFSVSTDDPGVVLKNEFELTSAASDTMIISSTVERRELDIPVESAEVVARFALLRAAALSGAVRGAYELTRTYVRTREQFGAPLVKLPAVASGLATMRTKVLEAKAAVDAAVESESLGRDDGGVHALAARVVTARCATDSARLAHQLHGAMGTTSEYPLHTLTTALWTWRDADLSEADWALELGDRIVRQGEVATWSGIEAGVR